MNRLEELLEAGSDYMSDDIGKFFASLTSIVSKGGDLSMARTASSVADAKRTSTDDDYIIDTAMLAALMLTRRKCGPGELVKFFRALLMFLNKEGREADGWPSELKIHDMSRVVDQTVVFCISCSGVEFGPEGRISDDSGAVLGIDINEGNPELVEAALAAALKDPMVLGKFTSALGFSLSQTPDILGKMKKITDEVMARAGECLSYNFTDGAPKAKS